MKCHDLRGHEGGCPCVYFVLVGAGGKKKEPAASYFNLRGRGGQISSTARNRELYDLALMAGELGFRHTSAHSGSR